MARLIWKENHKLAEQTVSLACEVALQPTHMSKRDRGFMTSCLYTVSGWYTMGEILIQRTDRCYLKRFRGEGDHRDRFLKCSNSYKSSRSSVSTVFLSCLQDWPTVAVSVVLALWCCLQQEGIVCAWCVRWHGLNISTEPVWWWKEGWKERQEEARGNTLVAWTNGDAEFNISLQLPKKFALLLRET